MIRLGQPFLIPPPPKVRSARSFLRALIMVLMGLAWLMPQARSALALPDESLEVVPQGAVIWKMSTTVDNQSEAWDRYNHEGGMARYLVHNASLFPYITGEATRKVQRSKLSLAYGMSDSWNLGLAMEHLKVTQSSSIQLTGGGPAAAGLSDILGSYARSGNGNLHLSTLHNTTYDDWDSFILGLSLVLPTGKPDTPWWGSATESSNLAGPAIIGKFQYTRFPAMGRARFDLIVRGTQYRPGEVELPDGSKQILDAGDEAYSEISWQQEWELFGAGMKYSYRIKGKDLLDGDNQGNWTKEATIGFNATFGNLSGLEKGPMGFPYRVKVGIEKTLEGYNTPVRNALSLDFVSYF